MGQGEGREDSMAMSTCCLQRTWVHFLAFTQWLTTCLSVTLAQGIWSLFQTSAGTRHTTSMRRKTLVHKIIKQTDRKEMFTGAALIPALGGKWGDLWIPEQSWPEWDTVSKQTKMSPKFSELYIMQLIKTFIYVNRVLTFHLLRFFCYQLAITQQK